MTMRHGNSYSAKKVISPAAADPSCNNPTKQHGKRINNRTATKQNSHETTQPNHYQTRMKQNNRTAMKQQQNHNETTTKAQ